MTQILYPSMCIFVPKRTPLQKYTKQLINISFFKSYNNCAQAVITKKTYFSHFDIPAPLTNIMTGTTPDLDSWTTDVAPLSNPSSGMCLVEMDRYLYTIGGQDGTAAINTMEWYSTMSGTKNPSISFSLFRLLQSEVTN